MLQVIDGPALRTDDYYIKRVEDGMDELRFSISVNDPAYKVLREEMRVLETRYQQTYVIQHINSGTGAVSVNCRLDLDDWRRRIHLLDGDGVVVGYSTGLRTAGEILGGVRPDGWTVTGDASKEDKCAISMQGPTDLEVAMQVQDRFGCRFRFDNRRREVQIIYPEDQPVSNGYIVDTVNARGVPRYTGASDSVYTRIYPIGLDGLTIAGVFQSTHPVRGGTSCLR